MPEENKRRRALRPDVRANTEALGIVLPLHREIQRWQVDIANLRATSISRYSAASRKQDCREQATALADKLSQIRIRFDEQISQLSPSVAGSPRISDTRRSLASLARRLETILGSDA